MKGVQPLSRDANQMTQTIVSITFFIIASFAVFARAESDAVPKWEVTQSLKHPDSVVFDLSQQLLYVSNVAGDPLRADGSGWISVLDPKGKVVKERLLAGLDAPKGMALAGGYLWVADLQKLRKIDIKTGQMPLTVFIGISRNLSALAIGPSGEVYAADPITGFVFEYREPKFSIFLQPGEVDQPEALSVIDGKLWVLGNQLVSVDLATREKESFPIEANGLAGLQKVAGRKAWMETEKLWVVPTRDGNRVAAFP